jgi:adenylate kinase
MIIYLTGSPASGKTTLSERLSNSIANLVHFRFGKALTDLIQQQHNVTQEDLRAATSHISTPHIVDVVNEMAIAVCAEHKATGNVIIDTHAVTTEKTGFRITPMSIEQMRRLDPDIFVCLTAQPKMRRERVLAAANGRPSLTEEQLRTQAQLQESLIVSYSAAIGKPAYFMCNETDEDLCTNEAELLALINGD